MLIDHTLMEPAADIVGLVGVALYFSAYTLLQSGILRGGEVPYTTLNLLAATCVLFSLTADFNASSLLIQLFWIVVSLLTLLRIAIRRSQRVT